MLIITAGVTISLNGEPIPNSNISRRSVYDFEFVNSNDCFSSAMRCQSEWRSEIVPEFSHVCHVGDGDSPVTCHWPDTVHINYTGGVTRGWGGLRVSKEGGYRVNYLWRRWETPEEGYFNCYMRGDINPLSGLYILYPSEWPSLMVDYSERCSVSSSH